MDTLTSFSSKAGITGRSQGKEEMGIDICVALSHWMEYKRIETLLQTFIIPLQSLADHNSRIHCSMNMNTETGRISARKPNLMNQPAYDKYQIRDSFVPRKGCKFVVADYGQLELRVLAHMTNCKSMIEAFKSGGDFHSRTAIVQSSCQARECFLKYRKP